MILYRLKCKKGHEFEAWFASGVAFEKQENARTALVPELRHHEGVKGADGAEHLQAHQGATCCQQPRGVGA